MNSLQCLLVLVVVCIIGSVPVARAYSARSVSGHIFNFSNHSISLATGTCLLAHGILSTSPPSYIPANQIASFEADSDGFMTGTEGECEYAIDNVGVLFTIFWDNPYIGDNTFSSKLDPDNIGYSTVYNSTQGDHASVTYTLTLDSILEHK